MSRRVELTTRQAEVVERVAKGMPDKRIAAELGISTRTVEKHVEKAAERIPGTHPVRIRLALFFFGFLEVSTT